MFRRQIPTIVAAALAFGLGSAAIAQDAPQFEDAQLQAFAETVIDLREIRARFEPQIESAETPEAQMELIEAANQEMVAAVEARPDMTVDEYNAIAEASTADPEVAERIVALLEESLN